MCLPAEPLLNVLIWTFATSGVLSLLCEIPKLGNPQILRYLVISASSFLPGLKVEPEYEIQKGHCACQGGWISGCGVPCGTCGIAVGCGGTGGPCGNASGTLPAGMFGIVGGYAPPSNHSVFRRYVVLTWVLTPNTCVARTFEVWTMWKHVLIKQCCS